MSLQTFLRKRLPAILLFELFGFNPKILKIGLVILMLLLFEFFELFAIVFHFVFYFFFFSIVFLDGLTKHFLCVFHDLLLQTRVTSTRGTLLDTLANYRVYDLKFCVS